MVRILHVIGSMNSGGAETMLMNIYRKIDRSKIQFDFVVHTSEEGFYDKEILALGGKIFRVKQFNVANIFLYQSFWNNFFLKHKEYYIIHAHINSSAAIYLNCAKKHGRIAVVHSHSTKNKEKSLRSFAFQIFSYPIRYIADYFFACSVQAGIDRFGRKTIAKKRFKVIENGIDTEKYRYNLSIRNKIRSKMGIDDNRIILGHVGRFTFAKNHEFLIKVFSYINKIEPAAELWLIGTGELEEQTKRLVKENKIQNKVRFLGVTDKVKEYLQAFDVFVFPSIFEGVPVALIEAQAAGLPCIVSSNIRQESDIGAELLNFLSLSSGIENWADVILSKCRLGHKDTSKYVKEAGYEVKDISKKLQKFYLSIEEKR